MELQLPLANVHFRHTNDSLKFGRYFEYKTNPSHCQNALFVEISFTVRNYCSEFDPHWMTCFCVVLRLIVIIVIIIAVGVISHRIYVVIPI